MSICDLYLGSAAHADDVRTLASTAKGAGDQSTLISEFTANHGLTLNSSKTEIIKFGKSMSNISSEDPVISVPILSQAKCLGYLWSKSLSARAAVEENIAKAHRKFFALGSKGCYLGRSNPLSAKTIVETCVMPGLLYGAENWILGDPSLNRLESFHSVNGRRILKLSRFHSQLSVLVGLSWPSMSARVLLLKLSFLYRVLSSERNYLATRMFRTLASQDIYAIGIVQQCMSLGSKLSTQSVATILNSSELSPSLLNEIKKSIQSKDWARTLLDLSVRFVANINWLRIWDAVRDRGPYWSKVTQSFFRVLTFPLFGDRLCHVCSTEIPEDICYYEHLVNSHCQNHPELNPDTIPSELRLNPELSTSTLHLMTVIISSNCIPG